MMDCHSLKGFFATRSCSCTLALLVAASLFPAGTWAQAAAGAEANSDAMRQLSASFENLAKRVSPAVVEILVTGYGSPSDEDSSASSALERARSLGAGVIVDPEGYIITNYHVVK